jgi:phosphate-selective porin OprO/OprP
LVSGFGNLPHQERILNPFFEARTIGGQVTHVTEDQLWTVRAGVFNDSRFETGGFDSNDWRVATRLTHLVWDEPERGRYLHWGLAGRYVGAAAGTLRYGGRPASNVTLNFVDTGEFPAEHAWHVGVEWLWNEGPFSVLAEANQAWVTSSAMGDPFFWGAYVTFAWVLTGESRSYDRTVGYARRINPKGKWGAPELVVRLAHLDLDDARASGGVLDRLSIGLNWWATRRWKVGVDCGRTRLNRDSLTSTTEAVMARMQWIF